MYQIFFHGESLRLTEDKCADWWLVTKSVAEERLKKCYSEMKPFLFDSEEEAIYFITYHILAKDPGGGSEEYPVLASILCDNDRREDYTVELFNEPDYL